MVLNKLQVFQLGALLIKLCGNITVTLRRSGGLAEQNVLTSRSSHDGIRIYRFDFAGIFVIEKRTVTFSVLNQSGMELSTKQSAYQSTTLVFSRFSDKRSHNLLSCGSPGVCGTVSALSTECTKSYFSVIVSAEYNPKGFEPTNDFRCRRTESPNRLFLCNITAAF